ncbi:MAG: thioredoxin-dependent peroxiredoxin [Solirubrobacteraceae bacterium]|jgi:peroxiredoxin Q/BCP|nr:thioredoxin-dependent peroxiredoxin [Solirubrobacteraceae bacterium]
MAKGPQPGDPAPDFELAGTDGTFRLSEHRGERVVLLFYPGDETPTCTRQFCSYRDRSDEMAGLDATVVGISAQSVDSHERFREHHGLTVPLLADGDKAVAKAYGVAAPVVGIRRAVIVIDADGVVRQRHVHTLGVAYEDVDSLREMLAGV